MDYIFNRVPLVFIWFRSTPRVSTANVEIQVKVVKKSGKSEYNRFKNFMTFCNLKYFATTAGLQQSSPTVP